MNTSHASKLSDRASLLARARAFFAERGVMEVDVPLLSPRASVDAHIDLIPTLCFGKERRYLHSSPEYGMKRLLAQGCGDIYQLMHVFRDFERGRRHSPEFMMCEWYRIGFSFKEMIEETLAFIRLFLGDLPTETISYREAFQKYAALDPEGHADEAIHLLLADKIEPHLGKEKLTVLWGYPASQASLAQVLPDGQAERFEVYYEGVELCNGYHELADAAEQRKRLEEANAERLRLGKEELPLDEHLLAALESGLPDCCGVAVGFDRLMMLRHRASSLDAIHPFPWEEA